ncbi:MAG: hypothetical protein JKX73_02635, partial [Flavobacteriales bacterium]|nr:hypothetical protein [Flavobacteriales bacterium]
MMKFFTPLLIAILCPFCALSQNLVSINPISANAGQTLNVTITGANTNFAQGSGSIVEFYFNQGSGTTVVISSTVLSNTSISANIIVPSNTFTGDYDVFVYNSIDGYLYLFGGFHVNGITPPSLVSINPASANAGQTLNVTITGASTNFAQGSGSIVEFYFNQGSGTTVVNSSTALSNTSISANITVPSNTFTGNYTVSVYNPIDGYLSLYNGFNVNGIAPPSLVSINPASANAGQTLNVTITGASTNFAQGSGSIVEFDFGQGSGTTVVNSSTVLSNTSISANITV